MREFKAKLAGKLEGFPLKVVKELASRIKVACVAHSVIRNPQTVDEAIDCRQADRIGPLRNDRGTSFDDPRFIVGDRIDMPNSQAWRTRSPQENCEEYAPNDGRPTTRWFPPAARLDVSIAAGYA